MNAFESGVPVGKIELPEVEFQLVGSSIDIRKDRNLWIVKFQSLQLEQESIFTFGCISHFLDVQRKFATVGFDG